ncbi:hypothetical protein GmHk_15G044314 [Glycine max]|nr:hypothetical protein GmHk_15G044314 [Glycine max]
MRILSLNVRGISDPIKRKRIKLLVEESGVNFYMLQETKCEHIELSFVRDVWRSQETDFEWIYKPSTGLTGKGFVGVCVDWKKNLNAMYADQCIFPMCDGGSREINIAKIEGFNSFISDIELMKVPTSSKKFTWVNADGSSMTRLDRFLISEDLFELWNILEQWIGRHDISDHSSILLKNEGPKPFKFFNNWMEHPSFKKLVLESWTKPTSLHWNLSGLREKLKTLKGDLKIDLKIESLVQDWDALDEKLLDGEEHVTKKGWRFINNFGTKRGHSVSKIVCTLAETRGFQLLLLRLTYVRETKEKSTTNFTINDVARVKVEVIHHLESLFQEVPIQRPNLDGIQFKQIEQSTNVALVASFFTKEIKSPAWSCYFERVRGWMANWDIVGGDVCDMIQEFYHNTKIPKTNQLSLLHYSLDSLIVGELCYENLWALEDIFISFEMMEGLRVNVHKSNIYGVNIGIPFLRATKNFLHCNSVALPFKFLGLPIKRNPRRRNT